MLSSSSEYLEALRVGNYLLFLEWPLFVLKHYSAEGKAEGTDFLMDCLVFEWLKQGSCEQDAQHLALLHAVYEVEPCLLVGQLAFNLMSVYSALFVCMALQTHDLHGHVLPQETLTGPQIITFMNKITENEKGDSHHGIRDEFIKRSQEVDPILVKTVYKKIHEIRQPILIIEKYIEALAWDQREQSDIRLYDARLAIAKGLLVFLRKQEALTDAIRLEIDLSIEAIRQKQPMFWESEYLELLSPPSLKTKALLFVHSLRSRFFEMVLPQRPVIRDKEGNIENSEPILK